MIQYEEPDEFGELSIRIISKKSAIIRGRINIENRIMGYNVAPSDDEALDDFKTTHAAYEVDNMYNHSKKINKFKERVKDKIQIRTDRQFEKTVYQAKLCFMINYSISDFTICESELGDADKFYRNHLLNVLATDIYQDVNSLKWAK